MSNKFGKYWVKQSETDFSTMSILRVSEPRRKGNQCLLSTYDLRVLFSDRDTQALMEHPTGFARPFLELPMIAP